MTYNMPAPNCVTDERPPVAQKSPVEEYIAILRSYLTSAQKHEVRRRVERDCLQCGLISTLAYADILQSFLTPWQKAGAVERLETVFSNRGWLDQNVS